jgi:hypothetical protein
MLNKLCIAIVGALTVLPQTAFAAENIPSLCIDISVPKGAIAARNGKWIELTAEQWQFLRGIYAMNPGTPAGLPYGDKAVLAEVEAIRAASSSSSTATKPAPRCRCATNFSR